MVSLQFVASNLQVTNHRLNLQTSLKVCQIYIGRTSRIFRWRGDRFSVVCSIDLILSIACIHENRLIGHTIHIIDDCIGTGNINRILSHHRCLHSHVVETCVGGQCLKHKDISQTAIDILSSVDNAFEVHDAFLFAVVNNLAILVIQEFVRVITIDTCLCEESQVHFYLIVFTIDIPAALIRNDRAVVERNIHL